MDHSKLIDLFEVIGVLLNVYYTPVAFVDKEAIDSDQSPESQPTYDFIIPWANDPTLTSTFIAIGAFIVVASMAIARVLLSQKREERKQFISPQSALLHVGSIVGIFIVLILGGAPLNHGYQRTGSLALLLSVYATLPIVIQSGSLNEDIIRNNKRTLSLTVIGAWIAIIPIGLDWERPWQVYPLTIAVGSTIGYATARLTDMVSRP